MLAAATAKAERHGEAEVLAALFHDIGHLVAPQDAPDMDGLGIVDHERIGAAWLEAFGFGPTVSALVGAHVEAKRYLAFRKAGYNERLSDASRGTLAFQGGPMAADEAARFEGDPLFASKIRLRTWDEAAKVAGRVVPDLDTYAVPIRRFLEQGR